MVGEGRERRWGKRVIFTFTARIQTGITLTSSILSIRSGHFRTVRCNERTRMMIFHTQWIDNQLHTLHFKERVTQVSIQVLIELFYHTSSMMQVLSYKFYHTSSIIQVSKRVWEREIKKSRCQEAQFEKEVSLTYFLVHAVVQLLSCCMSRWMIRFRFDNFLLWLRFVRLREKQNPTILFPIEEEEKTTSVSLSPHLKDDVRDIEMRRKKFYVCECYVERVRIKSLWECKLCSGPRRKLELHFYSLSTLSSLSLYDWRAQMVPAPIIRNRWWLRLQCIWKGEAARKRSKERWNEREMSMHDI